MASKASKKVPEGKMVNIEVKTSENSVENVKLTGDFFIEPPEALEDIEKAFEGLDLVLDEEKVLRRLEEVEADLIGFSREDLVEVFAEALDGDQE
ncbi:MAG: lipoate protein ligase C-terminal domain-containing protein [Candidatus Nanohalobium sp.]